MNLPVRAAGVFCKRRSQEYFSCQCGFIDRKFSEHYNGIYMRIAGAALQRSNS